MFFYSRVKEILKKEGVAPDEKDVIVLGRWPILYSIPCNAQQMDDPEHCYCDSA
jgi:hypothetical protein